MTAIPLFEQSSQYRFWRYSSSQLAQLRQDLNQSAVDRVKARIEEERITADTTEDVLPSEITYLTVQDELDLVRYYLTKIPPLAKAFGFNDAVTNTSMSYLKRFYLSNTCMDYHPKMVMLTCLFLSTKTENQVISISTFASKIKGTLPSSILSLEFLVSQSLKFQFKVHHPSLAAYGILLDLQSLPLPPSNEELAGIWKKVDGTLKSARYTDLELLYSPSQVALAAFWVVDQGLTESWLSVKAVLTTNADGLSVQEMRGVVEEIGVLLSKGKETTDLERVREVDKRLKYCKNPEKDPTSALYKKRQAEAESLLEGKRAAKRQNQGVKQELDDPFGPPPTVKTDLPISAQIDQGSIQANWVLKPPATPPESTDDKRL